MFSSRLRVLTILAAFVCTAVVSKDEAISQIPVADSAQAEALLKFGKAAAEYEISMAGDSTPFKLNPRSIMNWTNPARLGENGATYLWFHNGRPQVIATIFTYVSSDEVREKQVFHSLSTSKIESVIDGNKVWHPSKPGVTFKPIPGAPEPAATSTRRRLQMRLLSQRFSGEMQDRKSRKTALRSVPAPLVTYEPKDGPCQSGAIFSLAVGTDTEAVVLIESRQVGEKWKWQYAVARFHYNELSVSLDQEQVWSVPAKFAYFGNRRSDFSFREEVYISYRPD